MMKQNPVANKKKPESRSQKPEWERPSCGYWFLASGFHVSRRTGSVLVMYMLLMSTLLTGVVATVAVLSNSQTRNTSVNYDRQQAFYAAEAGIERAVWNLNHNSAPTAWLTSLPPTTPMDNGASYTITATNVANWPTSPVTFYCTGTSKDGLVNTQASVMVTENSSTTGGSDGTTSHSGFAPAFAMSGADTFSGSLNIVGSFESTGSFSGSGSINLTNAPGQGKASLMAMQSYSASGSFNVPGDLVFNGGISTSAAITVGENMMTGGAISATGGNMHVTGNVTAASGITGSSLNAGGNVQSGGTLTTSGGSKITGNMMATNGITTGGSLTVGGNMQAGGTVTTSGSTTVTGSVQAGGSVSHSGSFTYGSLTQNTGVAVAAPASPNLSFTTPTVDTASISNQAHTSGAVVTTSGYGSNTTIDFSNTPVIEVTGSISLSGLTKIIPPTDGSTGTLLVDGNMAVSGSFGSSSSPMKVNIVTTGNYNGSGSDYVNGTICCGGKMTLSGSTNISGSIVVQNGITGSGSVTFGTYVAPPSYVDWQDANAGINGGTTTTTIIVSNFMGPIY